MVLGQHLHFHVCVADCRLKSTGVEHNQEGVETFQESFLAPQMLYFVKIAAGHVGKRCSVVL